MKTEIEVKFLDVNFDEVRSKLGALGATLEQPMRLMRRALSQTPDITQGGNRDAFIRLRDEGDKVTLTFKEFTEQSLSGAREHEVVVSDFNTTLEILKEAGLPMDTFHESKRETWRYDKDGSNVEIVLDEWPWLRPYIEIESDNEQAVHDMADNLGFAWEAAVFGSVVVAYKVQYPHMKGRGAIDLGLVRFGDPLPDIFK